MTSERDWSGTWTDLEDRPPTPEPDPARELDWWHRDHPTFTALSGFFLGLALVTIVPGSFVTAIRSAFGERVAGEVLPFLLMILAVPVVLLTFPRSRRFGKYVVLGMVVTLFVVVGVGSLVAFLILRWS